jgi:hypothetical protein
MTETELQAIEARPLDGRLQADIDDIDLLIEEVRRLTWCLKCAKKQTAHAEAQNLKGR